MAESGADLLARKEFAKAIPLLKEDLDKYPSNPRIRLQYADALAVGFPGTPEADRRRVLVAFLSVLQRRMNRLAQSGMA